MALPTPEEIQALTDTDLAELYQTVLTERHRRLELPTLPADIDALIQRFVDYGGDKTKLKDPKTYEKAPKDPKPPKTTE